MEKGKILLIEDDEKDAQWLSGLLQDEGYSVSRARDGKEGLTKAQEERYNLVILDTVLPDIKGEEACRLLKKKKRYRDVPVIALSIKDEVEDIEGAFIKGADEYIIKPPRPEHLLKKVGELLHLDRPR